MKAPGDEMTLSVIIPTYNRAEHVEQCLRSLQACGLAGLEAIVVDDGSTDETRTRFAEDPRCRYFYQTNQGPASARNLGVDQSRGRYLAFLDCDDRWLPGVTSTVVRLLERHRAVDAVFTEALVGNDRDGYRSWIETAGQAAFFELPHQEPEPGFRVLDTIPLFRRMVRRNAVFLGALVMRRDAFERAGRFDPTLCGAADWELWLRMTSRMTFGYWHEALAIYTRHDDNMSSHHDRMRREFCQSLEKILMRCPDLQPAERAWVSSCLLDMSFGLAWDAYDRGDFSKARRLFASHVATHGPSRRTVLLCLASSCPAGVTKLIRRMKHAVAG